MTGSFVLSPRAQKDFEEIWDFTAERWGLDQAESYAYDLWSRIKAIAANPVLGQDCSNIRPGYHKIRCGSHLLCYRLVPEGVDVVRILHERMDFERHFP